MPDTHAAVLPALSAMDRAEALAAAADCLERALRHERWGCSAQDYAAQAVPFLRAAGRGDLADRLDDDPWGSESGPILAEIAALLPDRGA